ncbi:hypothetical protein TNCV_3463441 [Trichonephila clavipes]|nr:hypothetical protein TNCV_3463441 [Trichonephila clavipes]
MLNLSCPKQLHLRICLRAYGLLGTLNPVSGKSLLDETTKLKYAEGVPHGYQTSGGGPVGGASRQGIWLLRCFLESGFHTHTQRRESLPIGKHQTRVATVELKFKTTTTTHQQLKICHEGSGADISQITQGFVMADENDNEWYNFKWNILHPLIYWLNCENLEKPETSFMLNDNAFSRFYFRLCRNRFIPQHCLLCCVITYQASDSNLSCFADVKTRVMWNGADVSNSSYDNFEFNSRSNYSFDIKINHQEEIHELKCLSISVNIRLRNIQEQADPESLPLTRCVTHLSSDLGKLCERGQYHNLKISSFRYLKEFKAHNYILNKRWPKLLEMHEPEPRLVDVVIRAPISLSILEKVLYFIYSGKMPEDYKFKKYSAENAELARVMDKYQLLNMYKVFVPRSKCIFRESLIELEEQSFQIELNYFDSEGSYQDVSFPKITLYRHHIKLYISVQKEKNAGFWLSYRLVLHQVTLESTHIALQLYAVGTENSLLHYGEHVTRFGQPISSGPVLFLGSSKTFGSFVVDGKLRLLLKILCCDGKMKHIIYHKSSNRGITAGYEASLVDLSRDMKELYESGNKFDCELISRYRQRRSAPQQIFQAHKAIISARLPIVRIALIIPVIAFEESIHHILNYVYTGRFKSTPSQAVLGNICLFCRLNKFQALLDYALPMLLEMF